MAQRPRHRPQPQHDRGLDHHVAREPRQLRELAPGASLDRDDLRLVMFRTRNRLAYLSYIVRGLLGAQWQVAGIDLLHSLKIECRPLVDAAADSRVFVEADGELLGTLPAAISIVPDALALLVP